MPPIELLRQYIASGPRYAEAKVYDLAAPHLTAAERHYIELVAEGLDRAAEILATRAMQHLGPVGNALDLAATVASAGFAVATFALTRAMFNTTELAAAKVAIAECSKAVGEIMASLDTEDKRSSADGATVAVQFMSWAIDRFTPLFEDLEAQARKKFPQRYAANEGEGANV